MTTPTFIMAVPWEQERVRNTRSLAEEAEATVVWDQKRNAMDTWLRMLEAAGGDAAIFLEDDIELASNWRAKVEAVLDDGHRDDVVQFFSMRDADVTVGSRYEPGRTFSMNQCYYLPKGAARELIEYTPGWLDRHPESRAANKSPYDWVMRGWMKDNGIKYWISVPSLVQHRKWKSAIDPRRGSGRASKTFEENR